MRIRLGKLAAMLVLACALPATALAQAWPQRPIKMIVPFPAGGGTDFIGRLAAKHLSDRLGQQVFVENRGGANGAIGLQALMQSDPDGYTIATSSDTPLVVNPWLYEKLPYQALRDFVPVATLVRFPGMLAVHPSVPAETVAGFSMAPWIGIIVPVKTPKEVVARLGEATLAVMRDPEVIKVLNDQQVTPMAMDSGEFEGLIKKDLDRWANVIKTAGIKGE
jgi:tripartite-type tricarboxylate transporter receptor subunit TctC